jgi:hypothetical protein
MIVAAMVGCSGGASAEDALVGIWVGTSAFGQDVTMELRADGSFSWSALSVDGTWEADATTLTFSYPDNSPFCDGGTLTWEYSIDGDSLTSDVVAHTCTPGEMRPIGPPDPDWHFQRQTDS